MVAGLATLSVFDDEHVVEHASRMGDVWHAQLTSLASRHEFLDVVRGRGQMIGIEFGRPQSAGARRRWRLVETARKAMFSQTLVVPLFQRYQILTQVAADNINVIKLLPPLIAGETEVELFVHALDELLGEAERGSGLLVDFGVSMAKGMLKRTPKASTAHVGHAVSHALQGGDRVVVTGAAGFIGSAVVRALLARDVDVVALLRARRADVEPRRTRRGTSRGRYHQGATARWGVRRVRVSAFIWRPSSASGRRTRRPSTTST